MAKRITWYETYTTICKYSAEISDEEAKLFEEDQERFFQEVDYSANGELQWDRIKGEDTYDFEIEDDSEV